MGIEDRAKATAKNVEGKVQEAVGDATGDKSTEAEGKAKQVEASAQHAKEDVKDNVKKAIDQLALALRFYQGLQGLRPFFGLNDLRYFKAMCAEYVYRKMSGKQHFGTMGMSDGSSYCLAS